MRPWNAANSVSRIAPTGDLRRGGEFDLIDKLEAYFNQE